MKKIISGRGNSKHEDPEAGNSLLGLTAGRSLGMQHHKPEEWHLLGPGRQTEACVFVFNNDKQWEGFPSWKGHSQIYVYLVGITAAVRDIGCRWLE